MHHRWESQRLQHPDTRDGGGVLGCQRNGLLDTPAAFDGIIRFRRRGKEIET
jgi:hypothetical protein